MTTDFLPIQAIDHVELYVGNAKQAAHFYRTGFGFAPAAYSGLETGNRQTASYVLMQGKIRLALTSALGPDHPARRPAAGPPGPSRRPRPRMSAACCAGRPCAPMVKP